MYVVNGGIPRSGTVLVGEILRALMRSNGHDVQRITPQERRHLPAFARHVREAPGAPAVLVHTHLIDADCLDALAGRDGSVLLWNHRDPRDAVVSLMRLHDMDLDTALNAMEVYWGAADLARAAGAQMVRYEDLVADTPGHIRKLGAHLGWEISCEVARALTARTSISRHAGIMHAVREGASTEVKTIQTLRREMREDPETLINDRHIQSGRTGRWRVEMTERAQREVTRRLATWIEGYGYAP